eukprot:EG_transcript_54753
MKGQRRRLKMNHWALYRDLFTIHSGIWRTTQLPAVEDQGCNLATHLVNGQTTPEIHFPLVLRVLPTQPRNRLHSSIQGQTTTVNASPGHCTIGASPLESTYCG